MRFQSWHKTVIYIKYEAAICTLLYINTEHIETINLNSKINTITEYYIATFIARNVHTIRHTHAFTT